MRLFINLDNSEIQDFSRTAVTELRARRSEYFPIRLSFSSGGSVVELPFGAQGRAVVKRLDSFSSPPVAWSPGWRKIGFGVGAYYSMSVNLFTSQMVDQFTTLAGEVPSVAFALEFQWEYPRTRRRASVPFTVVNDYIRAEDSEEPPEELVVTSAPPYSPTPPSNPYEGQRWINPSDMSTYVWLSGAWIEESNTA